MELKYRRMLEGMQKKQKQRGRKKKDPWFIYLLRCGDGSLYTGVTNDLERRFKMHCAGKGARYTRSRLPLEIVYQKRLKSRTDALVREFQVKKLSKKSKEKLVSRRDFSTNSSLERKSLRGATGRRSRQLEV